MRLCHFLITLLILVLGSLIGITGSNLGLADRYGVVNTNQKILFGHYPVFRSDEWGVLTPLCLSQMRHKPPFPIINKTIDVEGKNMLIVHDYGVPVKHISAIARPTTWGYFTRRIRFGMAWNWLFPIFIGFVGITLLFNLLIGVNRINMLLALAIVYAPICTNWSNFALYELGLGSIAAWSFLQMLKSDNRKLNVLLSLLCGWAVTAFVLTLYLPRLIPMSWLFIVFSLCVIIKDKLYANFKEKIPFIGISFLFICTIMAFWYLDAKDGIFAMLHSVYPGKRFVLGGAPIVDFVRGWFPFQFAYNKPPFSHETELSSFPNLIVLIILFVIIYRKNFMGNRTPLLLLGGLILFFYIYQYFGFPVWLAQVTFMGRTHPHRVDSSLMLAQVFFLIYLVKNCDMGQFKINSRFIVFFFLTLICTGVIGFFSVNYGMQDVVKIYLLNNHREYLLLFFIEYSLLVYFLVRDWRYSSIVLMALFIFPGILFNPVCIAPKTINSNVPVYIKKSFGTNKCRLLFATGEPWEANTGNAIGIASLGGVHHYVDSYMFNSIYKNATNGEQFNRFNHTFFVLDESVRNYELETYSDVIKWKINPRIYDFRELPIKYVAVKNKDKGKLATNKSLLFVETKKAFSYFKVKKGKDYHKISKICF